MSGVKWYFIIKFPDFMAWSKNSIFEESTRFLCVKSLKPSKEIGGNEQKVYLSLLLVDAEIQWSPASDPKEEWASSVRTLES